jgi:hypothetical protein
VNLERMDKMVRMVPPVLMAKMVLTALKDRLEMTVQMVKMVRQAWMVKTVPMETMDFRF